MNETEALKLLLRAKALWSKQPDDEFVQGEWHAALLSIEYRDANEALTALRDMGTDEPPPVGMIRLAALRVADRREAEERYKRRALEDRSPRPKEELISIRELVDRFFEQQGTNREAVEKKLGWTK